MTMPALPDLWPALAAVLGAALFLAVRTSARLASDARVRQLGEAAELLSRHAAALERFLGDPTSRPTSSGCCWA